MFQTNSLLLCQALQYIFYRVLVVYSKQVTAKIMQRFVTKNPPPPTHTHTLTTKTIQNFFVNANVDPDSSAHNRFLFYA